MQTLRRIPYWAAILLLIYMPFHIFLAQSVSLATGGLDAWKLGKDVVLAVAVLFTICLVWQQREGTKLFNWLVGISLGYLLLHFLLWGLYPDIYQKSATLGTIYNTRLLGFLVLGYGAVLLSPIKFAFSSVVKVVLVVRTVVASLGVVQYFLPSDLLTHVGYGIERGTRAAFFIEDRPDLPRVMSTLREPNALGAYLIVPVAAIGVMLFGAKDKLVRYKFALLLFLHLLAIFLTYSRSAWLGAFLALSLVVWWQSKVHIVTNAKRFWPVLVGVALLLVFSAFLARNTAPYQRYIVHSDPSEQAADLDSNDYHTLLVKQGLDGIVSKPIGHGPGTAGLASIQNPGGGQLTENYYVQIGYELGIQGLLFFVALNIWLYIKIRKRNDDAAMILCASFWAYVLINMLLHSWSNEAVAAQWWILAGVAVALPPGKAKVVSKR